MIRTRRAFLGLERGSAPSRRAVPPPEKLHRRSAWADRPPTGPIRPEDDVRFLLVHHTASPNGYDADHVPALLRGIFEFHTKDKGWPDVAYNFFVDAFGAVWEGREGSIDGAVRGDATGGSQGHAVLCCFIGMHTAEPPTEAARAAMAHLLAWQADRHDVDLTVGPTIRFVSRGSNRWPEGHEVVTDPIAGHRDMSHTECPGDAAHPLVRGELTERAIAIRADHRRPPPASSAPTGRPETPTTTEPVAAGTTPTTAGSRRASTPSPGAADARNPTADPAGGSPSGSRSGGSARPSRWRLGAGSGILIVGLVGLLGLRRRRRPRGRAGARGELDDEEIWTA